MLTYAEEETKLSETAHIAEEARGLEKQEVDSQSAKWRSATIDAGTNCPYCSYHQFNYQVGMYLVSGIWYLVSGTTGIYFS